MDQEYFTTKELMHRLKVGKTTIYRRIADGTLPKPVRLGSAVRFKASEVNEALDGLERTQTLGDRVATIRVRTRS